MASHRPLDIDLMKAQASLEQQLEDARATLKDARTEIAVYNLPKAEQDLHWPEGPPATLRTLQERVRRCERTISNVELALTGADQLAAAK